MPRLVGAPRSFTPRHTKPYGLSCDECVLRDKGVGFVPPSAHPEAKILLVGDLAGYDDARVGEPFVGAAGSMLTRILKVINRTRDDYQIDNAVRCCPPDLNLAPFPQAVDRCRYIWSTIDSRIAQHGPNTVVVPMGAIALSKILGFEPKTKGIAIENFHGTVQRDPTDRFWVVPTFHPSYLQRGATNLMGVVAMDLQRAEEVLAHGWPPDPGVLVEDPPVEWFQVWAEQALAAMAQDPYLYPLAVDIETPEKGIDEGALVGTVEDATYQVLRVNFAIHPDEGITVPYTGPYIPIIESLLACPAVKYFWYKGYDEPRLRAAGHLWHPQWSYDLMWAAKALQSDLPQSLGFWAPLYSRWGAWKHLAAMGGPSAVRYAAIDGLQTRRVGDGICADLVRMGRWKVFSRHMHEFHAIVLQPATDIGVPVDRPALEAFKLELDAEAGALLDRITAAVPQDLCPLTPKLGMVKPPRVGAVHSKATDLKRDGTQKKDAGDPLKMELYAKALLVSREVERAIPVCHTCGKVQVAKTHRCERALIEGVPDPTPKILPTMITVTRWFWQEPFNPDSPAQMMAYCKAKGHQPGKSKQTGNEAMDRETISRLIRETGDALYLAVKDYRAVTKVRSTYVVATLRKLDANDRLHGTFSFKPSTMRLNGVNPNLQNVVADKAGETSLAAGFRKTIVARGQWVEEGSEYVDASE